MAMGWRSFALTALAVAKVAAQLPVPQAPPARPASGSVLPITMGVMGFGDPADASAHVRAGVAKINARDLDGALAEFNQAIADNPDDALAYRHRAGLEENQKRYDEARADLGRAIDHAPADSQNYVLRAELEWNTLRDDDAAKVDLDRAIALNSNPTQVPGFYELKAHMDLGLRLNETHSVPTAEQFAAALIDANQACQLTSNPLATSPFELRAAIEADLGDNTAALADFDRVLAGLARARNVRTAGAIYQRRGDFKEAIGDHAGAIADYTLAMNSGTQAQIVARKRAAVRQETGDLVGADADLAFARGDAPVPPAAADAQATADATAAAKLQAGDVADAIADLSAAIEQHPQAAALYAQRARAEEVGGKLRDALNDYDQAIQLDAGDVNSVVARANLRWRRNDRRGALADISTAIAARPGAGDLWAVRGRWEHMNGQQQASVDDLERAIDLEDARTTLVQRTQIQRDLDEAQNYLQMQKISEAEAAAAAPPLGRLPLHIATPAGRGTAYAGMPIWLYADGLTQDLVVRYPYYNFPQMIGSNRLEVKRGGVELQPIPLTMGGAYEGIGGRVMGSVALPSSPTGRLPLHALFAMTPGHYAVRWTVIGNDYQPGKPLRDVTLAQSGWLEFEVKPVSASRQKAWLTQILAAPPTDPGLLVGDYLPSLLADPGDPRVQAAIGAAFYSSNSLVAGYAFNCQQYFSMKARVALTMQLLRQRGPEARLAALPAIYYDDYGPEIVRVALASLPSTDAGRVAGALAILQAARGFDWPAGDGAAAGIDQAVLAAAPAIVRQGGAPAWTLLMYLWQMRGPAAHGLLWRMADDDPKNQGQAIIALLSFKDSSDLPRFTEMLMAPAPEPSSHQIPRVTPESLDRAFGEAARPAIERALAAAPDSATRAEAAAVLIHNGDRDAYAYILNAAVNDTPQWATLKRKLIANFPGTLSSDAGDPALMAFLRDKVAHPSPPPLVLPSRDPVELTVLGLRSADAAERKMAADAITQLAAQGKPTNLDRDLISGLVGPFPAPTIVAVDSPSWNDAVTLLGQLKLDPTGGDLAGFLPDPAAANALAQLDDRAVPALADLLEAGSLSRRPAAAEALGHIGGNAARQELESARKTEPNPAVRAAIDTALKHLGEKILPLSIQ